eukprot:scaffold476_cov77-Skeletonema_marinoi.AAC.11
MKGYPGLFLKIPDGCLQSSTFHLKVATSERLVEDLDPSCHYDADCSKLLDERLRGPDGERLRREFPVLAELSRGNVPAFYCYCQVGQVQVNGKNFTVGRSCYHIAHPHLFSPHMQAPDDDDVEMEDATAGEDDNIARIANATRRSTCL